MTYKSGFYYHYDLPISHILDFLTRLWQTVTMVKVPAPRSAPARRTRAYSRQTREAALLLGQMIRAARIERAMSVKDLGERIGASRDLMQRIEQGDLRVGLGVAFEAAAVVDVPLFAAEPSRLASERAHLQDKLSLLPKAVHKRASEVKDDF
jgi:transcriptional regulator with XRE-family HTH domain